MYRKKYDLYENEILTGDMSTKVCYIQCDCGHLAICQKSFKEIFRCSMCKKIYIIVRHGEVVLFKRPNNKVK